jgi:hypothetical protein
MAEISLQKFPASQAGPGRQYRVYRCSLSGRYLQNYSLKWKDTFVQDFHNCELPGEHLENDGELLMKRVNELVRRYNHTENQKNGLI